MSRYATIDPVPSQATYEADADFSGGLFMKPDRTSLQPGQYPYAENKRTGDGRARKRAGSILPLFANAIAYGGILASFVYSDPKGDPQLLIASPGHVWRMVSGGYPQEIPLPDGVTLSAPLDFVQVFDKVLLLRGENALPLEWDGSAAGRWRVVVKSEPLDTSTVLIPKVTHGVDFNDRFVFVHDRTSLGVSDSGDYTSYDHAFADFLINLGYSDAINALVPYARQSLIVGKENRIERFSQFTDPANPQTALVEVLSSTLGFYGWDAWTQVGGEIYFLSRPGGVYRLSQVLENTVEADPRPVSDPIAALIQRINWSAARGAILRTYGNRVVLAVPLDGAPANNCLLWYDVTRKVWDAWDTWDAAAGMQIDDLLLFEYEGGQRLWAVNHATDSVHLLEEGKFDETPRGRFQIADRFETRAYNTVGVNGARTRDFKRLEIQLATWWPSIQLTALTERANDARPLHSRALTADPRKWRVWGRPPYVTDNQNLDHAAAGREDYSFTLPVAADAPFWLDGVELERQQQMPSLEFSPRLQSQSVSLRVESTQGDCDVLGVLVETTGKQRTIRRGV